MEDTQRESMNTLFGDALFGIENALNMYANSFFVLPPELIYEPKLLAQFEDVISRCHIYLIGYRPKVIVNKFEIEDQDLNVMSTIGGDQKTFKITSPEGYSPKEHDGTFYFESESDQQKFTIDDFSLLSYINANVTPLGFQVKYVGQAYGKNGSRTAVDRLLKHETLQKIAIKGVPENARLSLLLLEVFPETRVVTKINPFAEDHSASDSRISAGVDKLFNTSESELVSLYEASLIRYFYPEYSIEFKNSFPSTNLKILRDCYDKDFSAVVAEISFDELPFQLFSERVEPQHNHIAKFDLHDEVERKAFFFTTENEET